MPHPFPAVRAVLLAAILCAGAALADTSATLVRPDPALTPAEVIAIQLAALQRNDRPYIDAGIAQTWLLAHPDNKRATGPYSRFADMLRSPAFEGMLDHSAHRFDVRQESARRVTFMVLIRSRTGDALGYEWTVEKVAGGRREACWMTTGVSPPVHLGEFI